MLDFSFNIHFYLSRWKSSKLVSHVIGRRVSHLLSVLLRVAIIGCWCKCSRWLWLLTYWSVTSRSPLRQGQPLYVWTVVICISGIKMAGDISCIFTSCFYMSDISVIFKKIYSVLRENHISFLPYFFLNDCSQTYRFVYFQTNLFERLSVGQCFNQWYYLPCIVNDFFCYFAHMLLLFALLYFFCKIIVFSF